MKLKNLIICGFAALFALAPLSTSAHSAVLVDNAGLVSSSDFEEVDDVLWDTSVEHDVDIWVHTTKSLNNMSISNYADQWYDDCAAREDGIVLVVCTSPRQYYIMTSGSCIYAFTDAGLDYIEAQIVPKMSKGNYADAFITFAELCDDYMVQAEKGKPYDENKMPKKPYNLLLSLLIAIGAGSVFGGIGVVRQFSLLKSVHKKQGAADYKKPDSFQLDSHRDIYLYRKVERKEKPRDDTNRSAGGSTTRTGSSGQTCGGSGGTF